MNVKKLKKQTESSIKAMESLDSKAIDSGVKNVDSGVNALDVKAKAINLSEIVAQVAENSGNLKNIVESQKGLGEKFALKTLWVLKTHRLNIGETIALIEGKLRATYTLPESSLNDDSEVKDFLSACASARANKACGYLRTLLQSCLMLYKNQTLDNIEILAKNIRKEANKIRESLKKTLQDKETLYSNMDAYLSAYVRDFNIRNPQAQITIAKIPNIGEALIEGQRLFLDHQEQEKRNARFNALREALAGLTEEERKALLQ